MKKSLTHRLLVTVSLTGMFFQILYPLVPMYKVYAEDTVVVEESISSSIESSSTSSIESSSSITSSSLVSESSSSISSESSTSSVESVLESSSSTSSVESSFSSSIESISLPASSKTSTAPVIEKVNVIESSTSSANKSQETVVVQPETVITAGLPSFDEVVNVELIETTKPTNILADIFPFLFTDKTDYAPTDSALISGSSFVPNSIYTIVISSSDNPPVNYIHSILTSSDGKFTYMYQLDGNYRPNYLVEVKDISGNVVSTITFTDSRTINSATLNGLANVTVTPGATISAVVNATTSGGDDWGSTSWLIASSSSTGTCVNTSNHNSSGTYNETFNITAPTTPGTYNTYFRIHTGNSCSTSNQSAVLTLSNSVVVVNVAPVITEGVSTNVIMSQNGTPTAFALTLHATDADVPAQTLTWSISSNGSHGSATASGTGASKVIAYTPTSNYIGTDAFSVQVSDQYGLVDTILVNVTINSNAVANPLLAQACGLDIAIVIDNSTSIDSTELAQMKTAMTTFTAALSGTPTQFSVTKFATTANVVQGFTSNITSVNTAINGIPVDGGSTNWQDGLVKANSTLPNRTNPNLVIFASDGNPNRTGTSGTSVTEPVAVADAVVVANLIKTGGTRIIALGIGNGLDLANLQAISGPTVGTNLSADVITSDFATLATALSTFASQTCGGTITVSKYLDNLNTPASSGWQFSVNGQNYLTDSNGQTQAIPVPAGNNYSVIENPVKPGYSYGSTVCTKQNGTVLGNVTSNGVNGITIGNTDIVTCKVINNTLPQSGTINVQKVFDGIYQGNFTDSCFNLTPNGGKGTVCANANGLATFTSVPFGTYTVNETSSTTGYSQVNTTCNSKVLDLNNLVQNCSVTNKRDTGTLTIDKVVIPSNDTTAFSFNRTGSDSQNVTWGMTGSTPPVSNYLPTGTYTVVETPVTNWTNTSVSCTNGATSLTNIQVNKDDNILCTVTNVLTPSITIALDTTHEVGDDHTFIVTVGYNGSEGFVPVADGTVVTSNVTPGGSTVDDNDCTNGTTSGTCNIIVNSNTPGTFVVNASSNVVVDGYTFNLSTSVSPASVTFVDGRIVISPLTATNNVNEAHTFTVNVYQNPGNGEVVSPNTLVTFSLLNNTAGASFVSGNTCTTNNLGECSVQINTSTPGNVEVNALANITVDQVGIVRSTDGTHGSSVNGSKSYVAGRIIIVKQTLPDGDSAKFEFSSNYGSNFELGDGESNNSGFLPVGTYSVSELAKGGWTNTDATCDDESLATAINVSAGEVVTCTFTNTKKAHIIVDKVTLPANDPQSFDFLLRGIEYFKNFSLTDQSTPEDTELDPGTYAVKESNSGDLSDTWTVTNVYCGDEVNSGNIVIEPGQTITCTFTNTKNATLIVQKTTNPIGDPTLFQINLTGQNNVIAPAGVDTISDSTDKTYSLFPGSYSVNEVVPEGWVQTGNECKDLVLSPGETKTCVFTNTKLSSIKIVKNATVNALDNFVFNSTLGTFTLDDDEGVVGADDTYLNNKIFSNLEPGEYTFSEVNPTTLWGLRDVVCTEGENTPFTIYTTTLTGIVLTLPAGKNVTCTFNNVLGSVLGEQTGEVLAVTGDTSMYAQVFGLFLILGSLGVLVISKTKRKYSK